MSNVKVNPVSFKGNYLIKGTPDVLNEICWYLQKKKSNPELGFDFCDFRLLKDHSINARPSIQFSESIKDLKGNVDLFLTQEDKQIAGNKFRRMLEESFNGNTRAFDLRDLIKIFAENVQKVENNISQGKPILNIKPELIQKHLDFLNIPKMKILDAENVLLNGIAKGKFNIVSGGM